MTTHTGEAIEEEFDARFLRPDGHWKTSANGHFDYSPDTIKDFVRKAFLAGRQSMVEEIEGEMPAYKKRGMKIKCETCRNESDECDCAGFNDCRAQVLELIRSKKPTHHEP